MNVIATIEDLLEVAAGMTRDPEPKIKLDKEDITIMHSIARQVFKGTALTDRQFALMQEKLSKYKDQFEESCDFDSVVVELRKPLRQIDRSKYIKIVDYPKDVDHTSEDKGKFIKIRFPFRKTEIILIDEIKDNAGHIHNKGTHEHYFPLTEQNIKNILDRFLQKEFDIDQDLISLYKEIKEIEAQPEHYVPGIYNKQLLNANDKLKRVIKDEIGIYNESTRIKFIDRRFRYGITTDSNVSEAKTLTEKIAFRTKASYHSKPSAESLSEVLSSLWQLSRFPMLVLLDKNDAENQLHECVTYYRDILSPEEQSVLFRLDGDSGFNTLVKDRKLNNWVDKSTKIVYISIDKLPKLLINNEWKPTTAFCYNSKPDRFVDTFVNFNCDLIIYREELISPFRRYSKFYG